uniref:Uncharacterized protein n=1 Tax=Acrobeloides nanus TaxID=290746 RepID=A0A914EFP2_9BILA
MTPLNSIPIFFGCSNIPPDTINSSLFTFAYGICPNLNIRASKFQKTRHRFCGKICLRSINSELVFVNAEAKVGDFRDVVEKENFSSSYIAMDEAFGRDVFHA